MKKGLFQAMCVILCSNSAFAWTAGQSCSSDWDTAIYYECNCPEEYWKNNSIIVGPCDDYEQIWCYDDNGICAGDGGEGACNVCACPGQIFGDWEASSGKNTVAREVITYSHNNNYYVCSASTTTQTGCDTGYYLNGRACSRCPYSDDVYGSTIIGTGTSVLDCFIPSNTSLSDTFGTYIYTNDCYFSLQ